MKLFVDTWGWLAISDERELRHPEAAECYQSRLHVKQQIITSDYVLDETFTAVFQRHPFDKAREFTESLLELARQRLVVIEAVGQDRFQRALALRWRFADKPKISFTDLTTMVIMRDLQLTEILSEDQHFQHVNMRFRLLPE